MNIKELFVQNRHDMWSLSDCNGTRTPNQLFRKRTPNHLGKLAKWLGCVTVHLTGCSYHVTYAFQSKSTLNSFLNVKELLARNIGDIWSLSDCNPTRTHSHLVRKWTFNHLAKVAKWLSYGVSSYVYGAFDCMLLSYHLSVSEWLHTL